VVKPFTPEEAQKAKSESIPEYVIEAFNAQLAKNVKYGRATIYQEDVLREIVDHMPAEVRRDNGHSFERLEQFILDNSFLDVEPLYRSYGWSVEFDRPGYNESYKAHYKFVKK